MMASEQRLREEVDVRSKMKSAAMSAKHMEEMAQERMSVVLTESHVMDALERLKKERETENEMGLKKREDEQQYVQEERRAQAGAAEQPFCS